jgi:DNA primase
MSGRVVIPIHNDWGELLAYAGRSIDDTEPRYKLPAGFYTSAVLYNLHRVSTGDERKGSVVVGEGFFDSVRVTEAGFACVALMGSSMSPEQERLLTSRFEAVRLLLDGDEAGRAAAMECAGRLVKHVFTKVLLLSTGMQPDAIEVEQLRLLLG